MSSPAPILSARGVSKTYRASGEVVRALLPIDVDIVQGESLGIVGESGAGKTTLLKILLGLTRPDTGAVEFGGSPILARSRGEAMREFRRAVQVVFQDPKASLNPRMRVADIIAEPLESLRIPGVHRARVSELLAAVGLPPDVGHRYPDSFSGGERQRIAIARALAPGPQILFGDEPVSALDVSVRQQIMELLAGLRVRFGLTLVLVSHDLAIVGQLCQRVLILHHGAVVEAGPVAEVFAHPQHTYTQQLLAAVPTLD